MPASYSYKIMKQYRINQNTNKGKQQMEIQKTSSHLKKY